MKEIKFRRPYYGYINKEFICFVEWIPSSVTIHPDIEKESFPEDHPIFAKPDEQYIGIKDNSPEHKEIYEGDIVKVWYYSDDTYIGQVIYDPKKLAFRLRTREGLFVVGWFDYDNIKTIGNVHQNPEMIKL